jgi:alpha-beta hydrolase superfamily lysophospholipase
MTSFVKEEQLEGVGGLKIFTRSWHPERTPRAVVVIVHGFNSHSGHYQWVASELVADGIAVYALDLRGRGRSEGERFYVEKFEDYVNDVGSLVARVKEREPGLPVFLLGHSAGGVVSCVYALDNQMELAGLICESFAHQVPAPDIALTALRALSHVLPHTQVLKLKNIEFSRDPSVVAAMNEDPLIAGEAQPTRTVAEMVRADARLKQEFPRITLPLFIMHGSLDRVTKPSGSQLFYDTAGSTDKTLKLYPGYVHDLLNDVDKHIVMADIRSWIEARVTD